MTERRGVIQLIWRDGALLYDYAGDLTWSEINFICDMIKRDILAQSKQREAPMGFKAREVV